MVCQLSAMGKSYSWPLSPSNNNQVVCSMNSFFREHLLTDLNPFVCEYTVRLKYDWFRNPGKGTFFSDAKKKAGKNSILSKLHFFGDIAFNWVGDISEDVLRKNLKKQFIRFW